MVAFILVCLVLLLGLLWGWEIRKRKSLEQEFVKKKNEVCSVKEFSDTILYNVDAYIILVDRNFLVEKTNYYNLNNTSEGQVLRRGSGNCFVVKMDWTPEPAVLMRIVKYVLSVTPLKSAFGKKGTFLRWKLR